MPTTSATVKRPLFLRSLQLLGFKTFARPTEIRFEGGVTAIVGPNGSGKTNIVDSVKWVLGSGQARDLRGRKMEDVIYAGGERRSRSAFAEVTVVFDNTAGRLPVDYAEVAITRRVQRDGESDYFLNGTRVSGRGRARVPVRALGGAGRAGPPPRPPAPAGRAAAVALGRGAQETARSCPRRERSGHGDRGAAGGGSQHRARGRGPIRAASAGGGDRAIQGSSRGPARDSADAGAAGRLAAARRTPRCGPGPPRGGCRRIDACRAADASRIPGAAAQPR